MYIKTAEHITEQNTTLIPLGSNISTEHTFLRVVMVQESKGKISCNHI
jgi:hypothetical protein